MSINLITVFTIRINYDPTNNRKGKKNEDKVKTIYHVT